MKIDGDDIYANNPVNYVKLDRLPPPGEWGSIVDAMTRGDYFVTSGEVLIPSYSVEGSGARRRSWRMWNGPFRCSLPKWCGATVFTRAARLFRRRSCHPSASIASRFRSTREARSGCDSRCGIRRAMAPWLNR